MTASISGPIMAFYLEVVDPGQPWRSGRPAGEARRCLVIDRALDTSTMRRRSCAGTPATSWSITTTARPDGAGYGVFPRLIRHAHRTAGFFKVRGVNITHGDFEDFMFALAGVQDFKCEALAGPDALDVLRVSYEVKQGADADALAVELSEKIRTIFELRPELVRLDLGTLAREFEGAVKAPRFQDNR